MAPKELAFDAPGTLPVRGVAFLAKNCSSSVLQPREAVMAVATHTPVVVDKADARRMAAEFKREAIAELHAERERLQDAADELMAAIEELVRLTEGDWEGVVSELVTGEMCVPVRAERLHTTGRQWATAIAEIAHLEEEIPQLEEEIATYDEELS
jgi:hypothetical protein